MGKIRHLVQLAVTALTNGYVAGFLNGRIFTGKTKAWCVPGLNCYSCPGALGSCPVGALQAVLGSRNYRFSFYVVGFLLFIGSLFGRFVCGWMCPFGLIQDLLYKIPFIRKWKKLPLDQWLRYLKYVILGVFVILLPLFAVDFLGQGQPWFCKYICPAGILMGGIPLAAADMSIRNALGSLFLWKFVILGICLLGAIAVYRPFCRYLCPLGAAYSFFNPIAFYRYRVKEEECTKCGKCQNVCKMDIEVWKNPNHGECIRCGDCIGSCPHGALTSTWGEMCNKKKKQSV